MKLNNAKNVRWQRLPQNQAKTWAPSHNTPSNSQFSQDYKTLNYGSLGACQSSS